MLDCVTITLPGGEKVSSSALEQGFQDLELTFDLSVFLDPSLFVLILKVIDRLYERMRKAINVINIIVVKDNPPNRLHVQSWVLYCLR